jgi:hypothetical protein
MPHDFFANAAVANQHPQTITYRYEPPKHRLHVLGDDRDRDMRKLWSSSSAIRLSPSQIRACGFPAPGSSRG